MRVDVVASRSRRKTDVHVHTLQTSLRLLWTTVTGDSVQETAEEVNWRRDVCWAQQRLGWEMTAHCCTVTGGRRPLSQHPEPPPLPHTATFTPRTLRLRCSHSNKMQRGGGRCAREEVCRRLGRNFAAAAAWIRPICCSGFKIL